MNIVVLERDSVGKDVEVSCFNALGDVTYYANTVGPEEVIPRIRDAEAVIANKAPLNRETLAGAEKVKFIADFATGYDNIDIDYCRERRIRVCNVVDYATAMVAQHTLTLALALSQKLFHYDHYVKSGAYAAQRRFSNFDVPFSELDGKTWGIVGMGHIGQRVAKLASAFGCKVITHSLTGSKKGIIYPQVDWAALLAESDFLSLHCPLTPLSRNLIDAAALGRMKPSAYLINVARGPVVNNRDLYAALEAGTIAGAGLDVLDAEPISPDNPLSRIQDSGKLIITPHLAWASVEARQRCVNEVYENLSAFLRGEVRNAVC